MDQDITPMMALNRASHALEAHTSPTMEEHSASLAVVALIRRERDPAPSMTVRSKVSLDFGLSHKFYDLLGI